MNRKSILTAQDICAIIRACGEHGVATLKFGSLEINMGEVAHHYSIEMPQDAPLPHPDTAISEQKAKHVEQEVIEKAEVETKADQLARLLIEDPAEYEMLMQAGELEDEDAQANN